jgi:imidazolonepropionase-like amidohydrolase
VYSVQAIETATLAGVETIERGDAVDVEVFRLMAKHNVGYWPTLAAAEAYATYFGGWQPKKPETKELKSKGRHAVQATASR